MGASLTAPRNHKRVPAAIPAKAAKNPEQTSTMRGGGVGGGHDGWGRNRDSSKQAIRKLGQLKPNASNLQLMGQTKMGVDGRDASCMSSLACFTPMVLNTKGRSSDILSFQYSIHEKHNSVAPRLESLHWANKLRVSNERFESGILWALQFTISNSRVERRAWKSSRQQKQTDYSKNW